MYVLWQNAMLYCESFFPQVFLYARNVKLNKTESIYETTNLYLL